MRWSSLILLVMFASLSLPRWAWPLDPAQWEKKDKELAESPTVVTAESMEIRLEESLVRYRGNVRVRQPRYFLDAQEMELRWDPQTRKIKQLLAKGKVRMETEDATGSCGLALVDLEKEIIEMTEHPKMVQGGEHVEGEKIVYSIRARRSTVLGGKERRVRTLVVPGGTK
jgi:lipopolysaccharide transport protein LptA